MEYRQVKLIGGRGTGPDRFRACLRGLAVGPDGLLYAAGDREVKVFDDGRLLRRWPTDRNGQCVATDPDGNVYVGQAGQIERFDGRGRRLDLWQDRRRLGFVTAIGRFGSSLFVADARDRCIRRFQKRRLVAEIGRDNNTRGFVIPNGYLDFCIDDAGVIHAANPGKHRVERYDGEGRLLGRFGKFGMRDPADFRGCCNPTNLTLTHDGRIAVTEKAAPRAKVYDMAGTLLAVMGEELFDPDCRNMSVAADRQGRIYVADTVRLHVCVFAPAPAGGRGR